MSPSELTAFHAADVAPPSSDSLPVAQAAGLDKFNLSGDERKEMARKSVRQTFTQLVVVHAYPAQKLQLPFVRLPPHL